MKVKIKQLTKEQILISIDRLTRFKEPEIKYLRVFTDIITSNLVEPRYKKSDLENMDYRIVRDLAEKVINYSLETMGLELIDDYVINQRLYDYENSIFNCGENVKELLKNKINYRAMLPLISKDSTKNLQWLAELACAEDIKTMREQKALRFPVEQLLLVEGITEETLLPEFARVLGVDFDKKGIYVISAGGKNQVVKYFYKLVQNCKLPVFILLDKDASENLEEIQPRLRDIDRVHILKAGEFEDVLPEQLVQRTLDFATRNISIAPVAKENTAGSMVDYLEEYFRHRGMHEFKKAGFAQLVKKNIQNEEDISDEIREIFKELSLTPQQNFIH